MKKMLLSSLICMGMSISAAAQELGRGSLEPADSGNVKGLGRATLPLTEKPGGFLGGICGLKLALGWAATEWDIGPADGSDGSFSPSASLFYKATDSLDINLSALFVSAEDDFREGKTEADMTRFAVGLRYWPGVGSRINPYLGGGIGYYFLDGNMENVAIEGTPVTGSLDVDTAPGAYVEGGVALQITDNFFFNVDLAYDLLLSSSDASIQGEELDFDIAAFTINLGVTMMF